MFLAILENVLANFAEDLSNFREKNGRHFRYKILKSLEKL